MSEPMNPEFRDLWVAYCEQKEEVAALTEQVATLTARLTELEGADIALEDAIAEMRRIREEHPPIANAPGSDRRRVLTTSGTSEDPSLPIRSVPHGDVPQATGYQTPETQNQRERTCDSSR